MGKSVKKRLRLWVQVAAAALSNGYLLGFVRGKLYTGPAKAYCLPGLNCYSCPGALGSCPIGSLQAVLGSRSYSMSFYVVGFLMMVGAAMGRFVCGWLCPFGLIQDLLYKIPLFKKLRSLPGERWLRGLRYAMLAVLVVLMPLLVVDIVGQGSPYFCKLVCPAGTLTAGWPLVLTNPPLQEAVGWLFAWKNLVLAAVILLSIATYRPFCRFLCPLGAIYGLFNPISFYQLEVNSSKCVSCGVCRKTCKLDIPVYKTPNSPDCIRCGDCRAACPHGAIRATLGRRGKEAVHDK